MNNVKQHDVDSTSDQSSTRTTVCLTHPTIAEQRVYSLLGVQITDVTRRRALELLAELMRSTGDAGASCVYFVNAHTLNLAAADPTYREVLNAADYVFGDGTGVRWAARLQGIRVRDNLVGTDLTPQLLAATSGRGYRCFLLGGDEAIVQRAAAVVAETYPGWSVAGCHAGYLRDPDVTATRHSSNQPGAARRASGWHG